MAWRTSILLALAVGCGGPVDGVDPDDSDAVTGGTDGRESDAPDTVDGETDPGGDSDTDAGPDTDTDVDTVVAETDTDGAAGDTDTDFDTVVADSDPTGSDTDALADSDPADTTVGADTDPVVAIPTPVVVLSPSDPRTLDDLVATLASPADLGGLTLAWTWTELGSGAVRTGATVPADATRRGDVWQATATLADGRGHAASGSSSVTVLDSPPVVGPVTLRPASPVRADTLACAFDAATDADGDPVDVQVDFYVTDAPDPLPGTGSTRAAAGLLPGDEVFCAAVPSDGTLAGAPSLSAPVTVVNRAPEVASVTVESDGRPTFLSTLTCTPHGVADLDGDGLVTTWTWEVDGAVVVPATGPTLQGSFGPATSSAAPRRSPTPGTRRPCGRRRSP